MFSEPPISGSMSDMLAGGRIRKRETMKMHKRYLSGILAVAGIAGCVMLAQNAPPQQPMGFFVTSAGSGKGADLGGIAGGQAARRYRLDDHGAGADHGVVAHVRHDHGTVADTHQRIHWGRSRSANDRGDVAKFPTDEHVRPMWNVDADQFSGRALASRAAALMSSFRRRSRARLPRYLRVHS